MDKYKKWWLTMRRKRRQMQAPEPKLVVTADGKLLVTADGLLVIARD